MRGLHLRTLFAEDAKRGSALTAEARASISTIRRIGHGRDAALLRASPRSPAPRAHRRVFGETRSVTETGPSCMSRCGRRRASIVVDGKNVVPEVHACSTQWPISPTGASGAWKGTPASDSQRRQHRIGGSDLGR